jgi:hypothetical protein
MLDQPFALAQVSPQGRDLGLGPDTPAQKAIRNQVFWADRRQNWPQKKSAGFSAVASGFPDAGRLHIRICRD